MSTSMYVDARDGIDGESRCAHCARKMYYYCLVCWIVDMYGALSMTVTLACARESESDDGGNSAKPVSQWIDGRSRKRPKKESRGEVRTRGAAVTPKIDVPPMPLLAGRRTSNVARRTSDARRCIARTNKAIKQCSMMMVLDGLPTPKGSPPLTPAAEAHTRSPRLPVGGASAAERDSEASLLSPHMYVVHARRPRGGRERTYALGTGSRSYFWGAARAAMTRSRTSAQPSHTNLQPRAISISIVNVYGGNRPVAPALRRRPSHTPYERTRACCTRLLLRRAKTRMRSGTTTPGAT